MSAPPELFGCVRRERCKQETELAGLIPSTLPSCQNLPSLAKGDSPGMRARWEGREEGFPTKVRFVALVRRLGHVERSRPQDCA